VTVKAFFARQFPKPWWRYERSPYRLHDPKTFHHRRNPLSAATDLVRREAGYFWWRFFWGGFWCGIAALVATYFELSYWVAFAIFLLGNWSGRMDIEQRLSLKRFKAAEISLGYTRRIVELDSTPVSTPRVHRLCSAELLDVRTHGDGPKWWCPQCRAEVLPENAIPPKPNFTPPGHGARS
jgi:hypothetical protein